MFWSSFKEQFVGLLVPGQGDTVMPNDIINLLRCDNNSQDSLATFNFLKQYIEGLDNDGMCMHKNFNFLADIF